MNVETSKSLFDEFILPLAKQKRTGEIIVSGKSFAVVIEIVNGKVTAIQSSGIERFLGSMLIKASSISPQELNEALASQQKNYKKIGNILIERGKISKEKLEKFLEFQAWDLLVHIFLNLECNFEFKKTKPRRLIKSFILDVDLLSLIKQGKEIRKNIIELNELIKNEQLVFQKVNDNEKLLKKIAKELSEEEKQLLFYIDGKRSVESLYFHTFLGEYRTKGALFNLYKRGLIKKKASLRFFNKKVVDNKPSLVNISIETVPVVLFNVVLVLFILIMIYLLDPKPYDFLSGIIPETKAEQTIKSFLSNYQKEKIKFALYVYYLNENEYPDTLDKLNEGKYKILKNIDLKYLWNMDYFYQKKEQGYVLLAPKN